MIKEGLKLLDQRQTILLESKNSNLKEIDNLFITMEGFGQYSMYSWLIIKKNGNLEKNLALKGVRCGGKIWSQDEGLALFLILDTLSKPREWAKCMYGERIELVTNLVRNKIN